MKGLQFKSKQLRMHCRTSDVFCCILIILGLAQCQSVKEVTLNPDAAPFDKLSEYHFFSGRMADLIPADGVLPFRPVSTLFSDYAQKSRFVWMPAGTQAKFRDSLAFEFPIGAVLIKNFFYEHSGQDRQLVETRLLVQRQKGWDALTYVWNENQSEAFLEIVGDQREITIHPNGQKTTFNYIVPDKNQCKNCHEHKKELQPIGPKGRNLDFNLAYQEGTANQLDKWTEVGYLDGYEKGMTNSNLVDWSDSKASIADRAKSYLEINCGTCHQPDGAAYVSGLYLTSDVTDPSQLGVCKGPVSAGKGSGGHQYDIVPGQPDSSILLYRMLTIDPGAMMPELGRKLVHKEGVELIRQWIAEMEGGCD